MAVTKEQLEQAIKALEQKTNDTTLSDAERAAFQVDKIKLSVAYKTLGAQQATQPLTQAASPETTSFLADRIKYGFTDFLSRSLPPSLFDYEAIPSPGTIDGRIRKGTDEQWRQWDEASTKRRREAAALKAQEWFGAGNTAPSSPLERYAGIAVESVASDPIMSVIGARGPLGAALNVGGSLLSSATGAVTYDAVTATAESLGASPEWQQRFGVGGAVLAGALSGIPAASVQSAVETANQGRRVLRENRDIQRNLDNATDYVVSGNMSKVIDDIVAADPQIDKHIRAVKDITDLVPQFTVGPGIALYDNPVIKKNMETLLKESPQFRASVEASLKDLGNAVRTRQAALFGTASNADVVRAVTSNIGNYGIKMDAANKKLQNIDAALDRTVSAARTQSDALDIGRATTRLIDEKEKALRTKNSAQYEYLLNTYTEKGVEFPASSTQRLHEFVGGATLERLFTPFPSLVAKMKTLLTPSKAGQSEVLGALLRGTPAGGTTTTARGTLRYQELSLRQLDSLKQELNKALRDSTSIPETRPALLRLKEVLNEEISAIPEFGDAYRAVDRSFYTDLGIPFDQAGLSQLDSLKFNETVGTYLSKPERAADFLSFVGDSGLPVVKDALLLKLQNKAFSADGALKPDAYAKFLTDNRASIDLVPGLRQELNNVGNTAEQINATRARLDMQVREADMKQADNYLKAVSSRGLNAAIGDILTRPEKLVQYSSTLKNLDPDSAYRVKNGIRTALLNRAFESTEGAQAFIQANPDAFGTFFGSAYAKNVEALAQASDIVRSIDTSKMSFAFSFKEADMLQKSTGSSIPQITSTLRDRIASNTHKATILLSRWVTKRTADKRDAGMISLLSSPEALDRLAKTAEAYRANQINLKQFAERLGTVSAFAMLRTTSMAEQGAEVAEKTPRQ
jgi:hypothetical protein